ncbi:hypothetical protein ACIBQ1_60970 [Nonomuraea sp. NPDC050153]|uniref:hypothetical protein n=1 Tax=Nonomuraea sp. NPDC050153 TaxID=3364359 RepID=UPI0037964D75
MSRTTRRTSRRQAPGSVTMPCRTGRTTSASPEADERRRIADGRSTMACPPRTSDRVRAVPRSSATKRRAGLIPHSHGPPGWAAPQGRPASTEERGELV